MCKTCENLQKVNRNLQKGVELRSNKCAKCVKRLKIYEKFSVKMGGLEGRRSGGVGGGGQYTLFKLVYILGENCAFCQMCCRFAQKC